METIYGLLIKLLGKLKKFIQLTSVLKFKELKNFRGFWYFQNLLGVDVIEYQLLFDISFKFGTSKVFPIGKFFFSFAEKLLWFL